jgi:uncharacterized protein CbrC (UPF0167 family)
MPQGKGNATNNSVVIGLDKLEFHTSWDWLMPVVRKIAEISCNEDEDAFLSDEYTSILDIVPLAIIEDAYRVVVEFIKWYNERYICGCCGENCNEYTYNEEKDIDECNKCK